MKVIVAKTIISDDVKSGLPDSQILILSGRQCQYLIYPLLLEIHWYVFMDHNENFKLKKSPVKEWG